MMLRWFSDLWKRLKVQRDPGEEYARLQQLYSEPHRVYHTLEHISSCLSAFAQPRFLAPNYQAIEFAIWYHDTVYNPRNNNNEEQSAQLAVEAARRAGLNGGFPERVGKLILSTKPGAQVRSLECMFMHDVDLSVLGKGSPEFNRYEKGVRAEFSHQTDEEYREWRMPFFAGLLAKPSIYRTGCFSAVYEIHARENLHKAVQRLSKAPRNGNGSAAVH